LLYKIYIIRKYDYYLLLFISIFINIKSWDILISLTIWISSLNHIALYCLYIDFVSISLLYSSFIDNFRIHFALLYIVILYLLSKTNSFQIVIFQSIETKSLLYNW